MGLQRISTDALRCRRERCRELEHYKGWHDVEQECITKPALPNILEKEKTQKVELPEVTINLYKPKNPVDVNIAENRIATHDASPNKIRHISFDVSGTELEGNVLPGQSLGVIPEPTEQEPKPKVRLYSVASPAEGEYGEGKIYSTTVKRLLDEHWETQDLFLGVCSNYLCDQQPGDTIRMTGPSGKRFVLPKEPENYNYVFFATGTGIAPFRGMTMELMKRGVESETALIFGCPYRTDLLYYDYFEKLARRHEYFHYLKSISREDPRDDGTKHYVQYKIIDEAELLMPILEQPNTLIYICGLKGMEKGIYKLLAKKGLSEYLKISDKLSGKEPDDWTAEDFKRNVKPGERVFLEVY